MCCGSAARRRFGAADHAPRQKKITGGGGVVRLTAKPRYLLLLHRGNEKSNTVTALAPTGLNTHACKFQVYLVSSWLAASGVFN